MIGFDFCADRGRRLEYGKAPALRARLAGLTMVGTSFGDGRRESPPAAAGAEEYRARALTSTVLHADLSDLPSRIGYRVRLRITRGGPLPPKEATRWSACRRNFRTFSGQPNAFEAIARVEFESARVIGKRVVTDQNIFRRNPTNQSD